MQTRHLPLVRQVFFLLACCYIGHCLFGTSVNTIQKVCWFWFLFSVGSLQPTAQGKPTHFFDDVADSVKSTQPAVSMYAAGFPCQSYSSLGGRKGVKDAQRRNVLKLGCASVNSSAANEYAIYTRHGALICRQTGMFCFGPQERCAEEHQEAEAKSGTLGECERPPTTFERGAAHHSVDFGPRIPLGDCASLRQFEIKLSFAFVHAGLQNLL